MTTVEGLGVRFTHLDKVLYPATGTTKSEVIDYYVAVAPFLLPGEAGRPLTRKRWPAGVEEPAFSPGSGAGYAVVDAAGADPAYRRPEVLPAGRLRSRVGVAGAGRRVGVARAAVAP